MNKIDRINELVKILNDASILYYKDGSSMLSDFLYDKLYDELVLLEKETGTILSSSPTQNVEPIIKSSLEKVEHSSSMLSLSKTKIISDLEEFLGDKEGVISWKLDGLTVVLTYDNGKLVSGVTRGNGVVGEVVTDNVKQFKNIPLTIPFLGKLVVRGEALIKYSDFNILNESIEDIDNQYKNPRNLCSGSVRQLDSSITAKRNVNCVIFSLIECSDKVSNSKYEVYNWLSSLGFDVVENYLVNKDNIEERVLLYKEDILKNDYPTDGLVLTYDDTLYGLNLGVTAKFPRHSIAYKWADEVASTTLLGVEWSVSRTGLINPVALFSPVELEGTTVSRASVHNVSVLKNLKLGIGDTILVYKANMIIPQIASNETNSDNIVIPNICNVCGGIASIVKNNEVEYLYCTNDYCHAKLVKRISLFVSRNAMNIDGISDSIINKLIENDMLNSFSDLYKLEKYKDEIINFSGFGNKSYDNMIESINKSRKVKLSNFIYALGIKDVGLSRAKLICKKYNNDLEVIKNLNIAELSLLDGVGDVIAKNFVESFRNEIFIEEINSLLNEVSFIDVSNTSSTLDGLVFVITGNVLKFANRDELVLYIEENGGKVIKAISNNVNYLINNDITSTSSKNKKAKEFGINIISEDDLIKMSN